MMKTDKPISSRYNNFFDLDDDAHHQLNDIIEGQIGRYPIGFRHLENYENYASVFPDQTIQDYHDESK